MQSVPSANFLACISCTESVGHSSQLPCPPGTGAQGPGGDATLAEAPAAQGW